MLYIKKLNVSKMICWSKRAVLFKDVKLLFITKQMQLKKLFKNSLRSFFKDKSKNLLIIETFQLTKLFSIRLKYQKYCLVDLYSHRLSKQCSIFSRISFYYIEHQSDFEYLWCIRNFLLRFWYNISRIK